MRSSKLYLAVAVTVTLFQTAAARAARVDMNDPRRALGREDDVRIDAQLVQDTVSSGSPVGVTYQVENLSHSPIAVADKVCDISYDSDSRTITLSLGAEVPKDGTMPRLVLIAPGDKKTFTAGAILHVAAPTVRSPFVSVPQYVQIKVNVLRDLAAFGALIEKQSQQAVAVPLNLSDQQFDEWLESNDSIFLNAIPIRYSGGSRNSIGDASQRGRDGSTF